MHTLSFEVSAANYPVSPQTSDQALPQVLTVRAIVDGQPLDPQGVHFFDAETVLANDVFRSGTLYFYTCTCGVPGCAGIFEESTITVLADTVRWSFPEKPFRQWLNPDLFPSEDPALLVLTFDRNQYQLALAALQAQIVQLEEAHPAGVLLAFSDEEVDDSPRLRFADALLERRQRLLDWYERMDWRDRAWSDLLGQSLEAELENGYVLEIPLENLGELLLEDCEDDEDFREQLEQHIIPELRKGLDAVVALARSIEWPTFVESAFCSQHSPEGVTLGEFESYQEWPTSIQFKLVQD